MSCIKIAGPAPSGAFQNPTVTKLTSGTSYTSPPGTDYLEVYCVGGGGGGGGSSATDAGFGGGAGGVSFKFFPPGTYTYSIGSAGSGGGSGTAGSAGGQTTFDTLIALGGAGGSGSASSLPQRGGLAGGISGTAQVSFARQPGFPATESSAGIYAASGQGGSNLFGTGGAGLFTDTATTPTQNGSDMGGGGAGGVESENGGNASGGGIYIIEHY